MSYDFLKGSGKTWHLFHFCHAQPAPTKVGRKRTANQNAMFFHIIIEFLYWQAGLKENKIRVGWQIAVSCPSEKFVDKFFGFIVLLPAELLMIFILVTRNCGTEPDDIIRSSQSSFQEFNKLWIGNAKPDAQPRKPMDL